MDPRNHVQDRRDAFFSPALPPAETVVEVKGWSEKIAKAKSRQETQEVREYEPTLTNHLPGKGHPEKNGEGLRVKNEPSPLGGILKSPKVVRDVLGNPQHFVDRRVTWSGSIEVVGADGRSCKRDLTECAGSSELANLHHCPSGCPGSEFGSGSSLTDCQAMADHKSPFGSLKIAAVKYVKETFRAAELPWESENFRRAPVISRDSWIDTMLDQGWLIRAHGDSRVRKFHPVHRGTPIGIEYLEGLRVSVGFDNEGRRTVVHDRWLDPPGNLYDPKLSWRGYTFFKLRVPLKPALGGRFVEGAGLPLPFPEGSVDEKEKIETPPGLGDNYGRTGGSAGSSSGSGYAVGSVADRGRVICPQLPVNVKIGSTTFQSPAEDPLSDDGSWEQVFEA